MFLPREPILLQDCLEGDSQREKGMFGKYHRLVKLATSSDRFLSNK